MFEPIHNKNNYQYIVDQIKQLILDGELIVGDRLPSERDLSEMYQVSRASVREALKALETIGLLESRHGGGNYIVNHLKEQLTDNLSLVFVLDHCKLKDLTSLRYALELEIMRNIIRKNNPETKKQLQELLIEIENARSTKEIEQIDVKFHTLIASLADNPLLQYLQASIHSVYSTSIEFLNATYPSWDDVSLEESQAYQSEIIQALLSRNMETVQQVLDKHYQYNPGINIDLLYENYASSKNNTPK